MTHRLSGLAPGNGNVGAGGGDLGGVEAAGRLRHLSPFCVCITPGRFNTYIFIFSTLLYQTPGDNIQKILGTSFVLDLTKIFSVCLYIL